MTLDEIKALDRPFLLADEIAPIIHWKSQTIRVKAREDTLPFPAVCHGTRVQIPRAGFIKFMEGAK